MVALGVDTGGSGVQGHSPLHSELEASLGCVSTAISPNGPIF